MQRNPPVGSDQDNPVEIQDIIVAATPTFKKDGGRGNPFGEFGDYAPTDPAMLATTTERINAAVTSLISEAGEEHLNRNYDNRAVLKPGCEHKITRLITNEFFFYSNMPLSIPQFEHVMENIHKLAANYPENFHLVLSSFSVKTDDDRVMNLTAHVQCGSKPVVNLLAKSFASSIDPVYTEAKQNSSMFQVYLPADTNSDRRSKHPVPGHTINIAGQSHQPSYNNVYVCKTEGGKEFYSCVDVCLDHTFGVARENLAKQVERNPNGPKHASHIVTSNSCDLRAENRIAGELTIHADPFRSLQRYTADTKAHVEKYFYKDKFGTAAAAFIPEPYQLPKHPELAALKPPPLPPLPPMGPPPSYEETVRADRERERQQYERIANQAKSQSAGFSDNKNQNDVKPGDAKTPPRRGV